MTQPKRKPIGELADHHITGPGSYKIMCPFCDNPNGNCGVTLQYRDNLPRTPVNLKGVFHCWNCHGAGTIWQGKLYAAKGTTVDNIFRRSVRPVAVPSIIPDAYERCFRQAWGVYRRLWEGSAGQRYLAEERKLDVSKIPAGWAPPRSRTLLEAGLPQDVLTELHLIDSKGYDVLGSGGGRVILPFTWRGKVTTLYGRATNPNAIFSHYYTRTKITDENGAEKAKWSRGVFSDRVLDKRLVVITESPLDMLALRELGVQNVCALGGTHNNIALTRIDKKAIVGLAFDNDKDRIKTIRIGDEEHQVISNPGRDAARSAAEMLGAHRTFRVVPPLLPDGRETKDWTEYVKESKLMGAPLLLPPKLVAFIKAEAKIDTPALGVA